MMNLEKDKQVLKDRLREELQRLRGYSLVQHVFSSLVQAQEETNGGVKKKKKKKGILYSQIESKYIGKVVYDTFVHSKGARRYDKCHPFPLCCVKRRIDIWKGTKELIVRWTDGDIPSETEFQLISKEKDFFIFLKITHYVKKDSPRRTQDESLSPLLVFLYDVAVPGRDSKNKLETERHGRRCTGLLPTKLGRQNGGNSSFTQLANVQGEVANRKRESPPKGNYKKFVDRYLFLVHYRNYLKLSLSLFLNSLVTAIFKHSENGFHPKWISTQEKHRGNDERGDRSSLATPHGRIRKNRGTKGISENSQMRRRLNTVKMKNDIAGKVCQLKRDFPPENMYDHPNKYADEDNEGGQVKSWIPPLFGRQERWLNFCHLKKGMNFSEQIYHLLREPNYHINIFTSKIEKGKEIFLTFHKISKCFFFFVSPVLGILNRDYYQFVCLSNDQRKCTTPTAYGFSKEGAMPTEVITHFLEELSHSIRAMYYQKKKLIRKLQKYLANRTLEGYINFRRFDKQVQKKEQIYSYTFYDIRDNSFLTNGEYSPEVIEEGPERRRPKNCTKEIPKLLQKIEPILTQCRYFNPKVDVHLAKRKLEKVCTNVTDMLTWCRQFRISIKWKKRRECIYVYFVRRKFPPVINTKRNGTNGLLMESPTGFTEPSPLHSNDKNTGTSTQKYNPLQRVQLVCAFQILSTRGRIYKMTKRVCFLLFSLIHKMEKIPNLELLHMLRHIHHIVVAFPYLYVSYAQEGGSIGGDNSTREKDNILGKHSRVHIPLHTEGLKRSKRRRKKALRRILLKEGEFPFLLKMHKLILYFYLYVIGTLCPTWLNGDRGRRGAPRQGGKVTRKKTAWEEAVCKEAECKEAACEEATCKEVTCKEVMTPPEALLRSRFDEFIKQIKREKWKKKIYLHLRNCIGDFLKRDKKNAHTGEEMSNGSHTLEGGTRGTKGTLINSFILRPICMDGYFSADEEATPEEVRRGRGVNYEEDLSVGRTTSSNADNHVNHANPANCANMATPLNSRSNSPTATDDYVNFFKLRNMKKTARMLGPALMDRMANRLYIGRNAFLNMNAHRVELLSIVSQFEEDAKGILCAVRKSLSHRGDIITTSKRDQGDPLPNLNGEEEQRLLHHICKKKRINKNLSIFNIRSGCMGRGKLRHVRRAKVNNKVVKSFFRLEKFPCEKLPPEESLGWGSRSGTHKVSLKYLVHLVNGHITFAVNIFSKDHQKWGHSKSRVYFLNVCKNDVIKNMLIERTIHFLEDLLTYVQENLPFLESEKTRDTKAHHYFSYNVCKIFCYELKQGKCEMKKIYQVKPGGEFCVHLFTLTSQATVFLYSTGGGGGLCNPFFVKFFEPSKFYDAFLECANGAI
ncbi:conserved Plasmodium protein, unknown function [Plasmodium knowlesi strain H]|uniref:Uncharacterized protein n=3 Tax=Plasmodium knowlesi TaxID=5850 RepID=A0A5K1UA80_PLAKH|nr:conserved Plasmodium protein, unknown function [Plasmodium knowlesi strain H]OTN67585.1 Uncharacterized protein PKNOH_S05376700 [Plasmodium knowlesi]CAA9990357.1 conserved Plasmodium protein, unknown function [Plasmodium knowlesi strain H]SBO19563.1 conserved Plasmodium protein, unknown function [Plasmodium knowlesi strain H]SBO22708.1 conserved Plasmodium protein, unknown function [Plasmodium knowlesi strain H]VVS79831.1 conserved Plasmodium protein, unknown function [Plasmodium knowlesi s|eukprot:XP_002260758.1 hypothetical protein, conserved in Plasmodium species [Plasmodium knowlesi strain H]